jgi:hypothetical protein
VHATSLEHKLLNSRSQVLFSRYGNPFLVHYREDESTLSVQPVLNLIVAQSPELLMIPFGFSVGDFFGAAGVIAQVVKALRKHGGAQDNYQAICFEVEAFGKLMEKVQALELNDDNKPHMEAIHEYAAYCKTKLDHFLDQIPKYEASLGESSSRSTWTEKSRANARKAKWALFMGHPVSEMRDTIKMAGLVITLNLNLIHL